MTADQEPHRSTRAALAVVFFVLFLDILGATLLAPILPFVVGRYSDAALAVTLMAGSYSAAQFLAAPLLGRLSDRHGRRPVLLWSMVGTAIGYVMFGVGGALWVLALSRLIDGITGGNISTAVAYVADVTPPERRARNFGLIGLAFGLGYVLGPALGGVLSRVSLDAPAFTAAGLSLAAAVCGYFLLDESLPPERRVREPLGLADVNPVGMIGELLRRPALRGFLIVEAAFLFAFAGVNGVLPVFLIDELDAQPTQLAGLFVVAGLATAVAQAGIVGALVGRFGERGPVLGGLIAQAVCYLGYLALADGPFWPMYAISALSGASSALIFASLGAIVANQMADHEQGKAAGVNASLMSLTNAAGPLWAGASYDRLGQAVPFVTGMLSVGLASVLVSPFRRRAGEQQSGGYEAG